MDKILDALNKAIALQEAHKVTHPFGREQAADNVLPTMRDIYTEHGAAAALRWARFCTGARATQAMMHQARKMLTILEEATANEKKEA